jgi:uncharacterized protein DUF5681
MADFVGDRKKKFMEHRAPPWQPGQSGNPKGRVLGSRNRMSESFLEDLRATWEKRGNGPRTSRAGACFCARSYQTCAVWIFSISGYSWNIEGHDQQSEQQFHL